MLLRSRTLGGIAHGFPVRTGGVSQGRYASLNLSAKWGDDQSHVAENRRRLAEAGGFSSSPGSGCAARLSSSMTLRSIAGSRWFFFRISATLLMSILAMAASSHGKQGA